MHIEWVIYHLIHNDDENFTSISDLDIDLCRSDLDQWDRLLVGFTRNRTVTSVELSRGYQSPIVAEDDLRRLFSALRHLPRLSKVKLDSFTTLDLEQTGFLFEDNNIIEEVWIENAHYHNDDEEDDLEDNDVVEDYNRYERFIGYLASMTINRLRQLRIEVPEKLSKGADLARLLGESSKLESLVVESTSLLSSTAPTPTDEYRRQNFAATMAALQSNLVLKTLDMDFHITFSDFENVATMLHHNKSLIDLRLRLDSSTGMICNDSDHNNQVHEYHPRFIQSINLFFEALKTNKNIGLKSFSQYNIDRQEFRQALTVHRDTPSPSSATNITYTKEAKQLIDIGLDMLQFNISLESLSFFLFDHGNPDLIKKKQMFLRLNQRGRGTIHNRGVRETVTRSSLVHQLSKHAIDDIDGLFYYISTNPWICRTIEDDTKWTNSCKIQTVSSIRSNEQKPKAQRLSVINTTVSACASPFKKSPFLDDCERKRQRLNETP